MHHTFRNGFSCRCNASRLCSHKSRLLGILEAFDATGGVAQGSVIWVPNPEMCVVIRSLDVKSGVLRISSHPSAESILFLELGGNS